VNSIDTSNLLLNPSYTVHIKFFRFGFGTFNEYPPIPIWLWISSFSIQNGSRIYSIYTLKISTNCPFIAEFSWFSPIKRVASHGSSSSLFPAAFWTLEFLANFEPSRPYPRLDPCLPAPRPRHCARPRRSRSAWISVRNSRSGRWETAAGDDVAPEIRRCGEDWRSGESTKYISTMGAQICNKWMKIDLNLRNLNMSLHSNMFEDKL